MSEKFASKLIATLFYLITAFCLPMFVITNLDGFKDTNSIYPLINLSVSLKMLVGIMRYDKLVEAKVIKPAGISLLGFALYRFY
jgi:hypothetical protein